MGDLLRITPTVVEVLRVLLEAPAERRFGLDIIRATGLPSSRVYPLLRRLEDPPLRWLESEWEQVSPRAEGRPRRRYYWLTTDGAQQAREALAAAFAAQQAMWSRLRLDSPGTPG
jgi:DNA-binding PadR family transcriptional regulator